jgi:hypothetical protein
VTGLRSQRKALASQQVLDQVSFAMDYMSRAIRMARKDLNIEEPCLIDKGYGYNYSSVTHAGEGIRFISSRGACQEFFLNNNQLQKAECSDNCGVEDNWKSWPLTSGTLTVEAFNVKISGEQQLQPDGALDNNQPRVTLFLRIKSKGLQSEDQSVMNIQTTITQRELDIEK